MVVELNRVVNLAYVIKIISLLVSHNRTQILVSIRPFFANGMHSEAALLAFFTHLFNNNF